METAEHRAAVDLLYEKLWETLDEDWLLIKEAPLNCFGEPPLQEVLYLGWDDWQINELIRGLQRQNETPGIEARLAPYAYCPEEYLFALEHDIEVVPDIVGWRPSLMSANGGLRATHVWEVSKSTSLGDEKKQRYANLGIVCSELKAQDILKWRFSSPCYIRPGGNDNGRRV